MQIRWGYIYSILNKCKFTRRSFSPSLTLPLSLSLSLSLSRVTICTTYINHFRDLCTYTCCRRRRINKLNKRKCSYVCNYIRYVRPQRRQILARYKNPCYFVYLNFGSYTMQRKFVLSSFNP